VSSSNGAVSVETRASRTLVGRVSRGESLRAALHGLVGEHGLRTAWISAIGAFEWIDLTEYNQSSRRYEDAHRFERCELLSLQGNLSLRDDAPFWHLHATVSVRDEGKDLTYGGHVEDGCVFALEFRIECFDEVELRRSDDAATGLQLWTDDGGGRAPSAPADPVEAVDAPSSVWARVAQASATVDPEPEPDQYRPTKGDFIEHTKFGLCKIEGLTGDGVCIIKLADARRKKIKLDAMLVLRPRADGDRLIYPVRPRPKR
jgi:predicted DNA-binding protein with PD1-like motif